MMVSKVKVKVNDVAVAVPDLVVGSLRPGWHTLIMLFGIYYLSLFPSIFCAFMESKVLPLLNLDLRLLAFLRRMHAIRSALHPVLLSTSTLLYVFNPSTYH